MSTAVIISGQMRTFSRCYPTQRWQVFRHYEPDIHFFVSCVDDENAHTAEILRQHYKNVHIEKIKDPTDLPKIDSRYGDHAPYANAASHAQLMLQHWNNKRAWEFFWESKPEVEFDTFIRTRPDNFFHRFTPPEIYPSDSGLCFTPWWGTFGGINDRFAIMGKTSAFWYFEMFDHIEELMEKGCPFHPESLVAASLHEGNIDVRPTLMAHFSTLRMNGEHRWPEVSPEDIAELITNHG